MNACKGFTAILVMSIAIATANAEMRVWTDKKGNAIEAQFIQMSAGKVVLETTEGKRLLVPKNGLCESDLKYLATAVPPTLEIDVDVDLDRDKQGNGYYYEKTVETVACKVTIQKTNKDQCTRNFKVCLYLLAAQKRGDLRKVMDVQQRTVSFEANDSASIEASATIRSEEGYSWTDGFSYEGYLVCVVDDVDHVIAVKTNKNTYETNLRNLMDGQKGTLFTDGFVKTK